MGGREGGRRKEAKGQHKAGEQGNGCLLILASVKSGIPKPPSDRPY